MACALAGYAFGDQLQDSLRDESFALLQALAAGMLLHVITSHTLTLSGEEGEGDSCGSAHTESAGASSCGNTEPADGHCHQEAEPIQGCASQEPVSAHCHSETLANDGCEDTSCHAPNEGIDVWASIGAVLGGVTVAAALVLGGGHEHGHETHGLGAIFLSLALQSAPALLIAYVLAGLLTAFITPAKLRWLGGGPRGVQALKGVGFGLPLPICSCGVLPLYETLARRGVPGTAAIAFLVATPELGLDAVLLSFPLLGAELTIARVAAAFLVAMLVALVVGSVIGAKTQSVDEDAEVDTRSMKERVSSGLRFGLIDLFDSTMPWVLAGLLIAAWVQPILGAAAIDSLSPYIQVPLFALLGIPLYVCAAGATPIAAVAIMGGVSPGAGIAFLLAGPATNVTTFGILSRLHNARVAFTFGLTMTLGAIGAGLSVDLAGVTFAGSMDGDMSHGSMGGEWWQMVSLGGLAALMGWSLLRKGPRGVVAQISQPTTSH